MPCARANAYATRLRKHGSPPVRPVSSAIDVIRTPGSPHAVTWWNGSTSLSTLIANPCVLTPRETWTPIEAILRSSTHTPVNCGPSWSRPRASIPSSASARDERRLHRADERGDVAARA